MKGWRIKSLNRKFELSRKILQELRMLFKLFSCCYCQALLVKVVINVNIFITVMAFITYLFTIIVL